LGCGQPRRHPPFYLSLNFAFARVEAAVKLHSNAAQHFASGSKRWPQSVYRALTTTGPHFGVAGIVMPEFTRAFFGCDFGFDSFDQPC
jgi:hypothetical protein